MQGKKVKYDLSSKVTPLFMTSPTESSVLLYGGRTDYYTDFEFVFANVVVSKSRQQLFFYPTKERVIKTEKYLFSIFSE